MKNFLIITSILLILFNCNSKKLIENTETLPKDISLKPNNEISQQEDQEKMSVMIKEIDALIQTETCSDVANWEFSAIGAKPCGGPSSYIAYPKKLAAEILPKVADLTTKQMEFNKKYGVMSDCVIVPEPTRIICENGKAVLVREN